MKRSILQTVGALPPRVWACRRHSQCQCGCLKRTESDSGEQCGPPAHTASEGAGLRPALKVAVLDGAGRSAAHTFYFNTLYLNTSIPQYTSTGGVKVAASSRNGGKRQHGGSLSGSLSGAGRTGNNAPCGCSFGVGGRSRGGGSGGRSGVRGGRTLGGGGGALGGRKESARGTQWPLHRTTSSCRRRSTTRSACRARRRRRRGRPLSKAKSSGVLLPSMQKKVRQ